MIRASLVVILVTLTWELKAFVLKSGSSSLPSITSSSTIAPSRLAAASRNVLNIRAGLPRGVFSLVASPVAAAAGAPPPAENTSVTIITTIQPILPSSSTPTLTTDTKFVKSSQSVPNPSITDFANLTNTATSVQINPSTSTITTTTSSTFATVKIIPDGKATPVVETTGTTISTQKSTDTAYSSLKVVVSPIEKSTESPPSKATSSYSTDKLPPDDVNYVTSTEVLSSVSAKIYPKEAISTETPLLTEKTSTDTFSSTTFDAPSVVQRAEFATADSHLVSHSSETATPSEQQGAVLVSEMTTPPFAIGRGAITIESAASTPVSTSRPTTQATTRRTTTKYLDITTRLLTSTTVPITTTVLTTTMASKTKEAKTTTTATSTTTTFVKSSSTKPKVTIETRKADQSSTFEIFTAPSSSESTYSSSTTISSSNSNSASASSSLLSTMSTKPKVTIETKKANTTSEVFIAPLSSESAYSSSTTVVSRSSSITRLSSSPPPPLMPATAAESAATTKTQTTSTTRTSTTSTTTTPSTTTTTTTTTTTSTVPEPCDRAVVNLVCTYPDFDKGEVFGKCTWDAFTKKKPVDGFVAYKISVREMTEGLQSQSKNQVTNVTSHLFVVKPGKQYEIIVYWTYPNADDSDMSDCKLSTFILAVPYERPKLQPDPDWLGVNITFSTVYIRNPFYQLQTAVVGRLSVDLTLTQRNNSSIVCEPAYWYNVPLSERLSCEIKNLNNDTIDELIITLSASGDPLGRDLNSFVSTKQIVMFDFLTKPNRYGATLPTPSSSPVVDNTAAAAGGGAAAGVVVGAVLVVLLIFLVRRHRRNSPKQTWQANVTMPPGLALADDAFDSSQNLAHSNFPTGPISADKFEAYIGGLERNSGLGYASLWEDVRLIGLQQTTVAAELPANRLKNRFTNVLPYDSSRVKLLPWPTSSLRKEKVDADDVPDDTEAPIGGGGGDVESNDYINANFVPGLWSDHEYIATQGPLPLTIPDFWRTIWQQRVCAVVMLTKLKEGGVRKCECYWPPNVDSDAGEFPFGPLNVQLVSQSDEILSPITSPDRDQFGLDGPQENTGVWTIRDFRLYMPSEDGSQPTQTRTLRQYQFNAWPDQGVPSGRNRSHLLRFVRLVRSQIDRASGKVVEPILVHCSAGVGRSGAFIAVDILLQDLAAGRPIDVTGVVRKLREYRQLVQTEQQFRFIYEMTLDAINGNLIDGPGTTTSLNKNAALNGNGFDTAVAPSRRNKGKANTAFEDDDDVRSSELDDRV